MNGSLKWPDVEEIHGSVVVDDNGTAMANTAANRTSERGDPLSRALAGKCHPERSSLGPREQIICSWGKRSEGSAFAFRLVGDRAHAESERKEDYCQKYPDALRHSISVVIVASTSATATAETTSRGNRSAKVTGAFPANSNRQPPNSALSSDPFACDSMTPSSLATLGSTTRMEKVARTNCFSFVSIPASQWSEPATHYRPLTSTPRDPTCTCTCVDVRPSSHDF